MRNNKMIILGCALLLAIGTTAVARAEISADEIANLGASLTPLGAEMGANAEGTIPAWEGGITSPPAAWEPGTHYVDPFADDAVLFTITADNVDEYADKLTVGQKALFDTYPDTYKMKVYPTRRSASYPQRIYDKTKEIAATARLVENGYGVEGAINGIPFPIPKVGVEAIWNHLLRYRAERVLHALQHGGQDRGRPQQHDSVLQTEGDGTRPARGRHPAGPGVHEPGQGASPGLALQPRSAAGAARAQRGL
jgi:hypothetical protein